MTEETQRALRITLPPRTPGGELTVRYIGPYVRGAVERSRAAFADHARRLTPGATVDIADYDPSVNTYISPQVSQDPHEIAMGMRLAGDQGEPFPDLYLRMQVELGDTRANELWAAASAVLGQWSAKARGVAAEVEAELARVAPYRVQIEAAVIQQTSMLVTDPVIGRASVLLADIAAVSARQGVRSEDWASAGNLPVVTLLAVCQAVESQAAALESAYDADARLLDAVLGALRERGCAAARDVAGVMTDQPAPGLTRRLRVELSPMGWAVRAERGMITPVYAEFDESGAESVATAVAAMMTGAMPLPRQLQPKD